MKHIIVDTNVLYADYNLQYKINVLCCSSQYLGHKVFIPEVVIDEFVRQYKESVEETRALLKKVQKNLKSCVFNVSFEKIDFDEAKEEYEAKLLQRVEDLGISIIPYPTTLHKSIVKRELHNQKPFKDSTKGYRDALIWESVKEHCLENPEVDVVLLTENSADFASKDKQGFHEDLVEDCRTAGIPLEKIKLETKIYDYIESQATKEVFDYIKDTGMIGDEFIEDIINDNIKHEAFDCFINPQNYGKRNRYVPELYFDPLLLGCSRTKPLEYKSLIKISGEERILKCSTTFHIGINAKITPSDYLTIPAENRPTIFDANRLHNYYYAVSDSAECETTINIRFNSKSPEIISVEYEVVSAKYDTGTIITD